MKIYHTETQEDYDALMVELEAKGIDTLPKKYWPIFKTETTVVVRAQSGEKRNCENGTTYGNLSRVRSCYDTPITKYKAKVNEMKFTKENVEKVIDDYFLQADLEPCSDLIAEIYNLDDTPEKVVVKKFVAEFYEECKNATLYFLITQLESEDFQSDLGKWYRDCEGRHISRRADAQEVIAKMKLYGYEVEKEPLYEVIIAGRNLIKLFRGRIDHEFAEKTELCAWAKAAYQLTEAEIKEIDERYWPFAVSAND